MSLVTATLSKGGIAVIPTDTIYGVVAQARDRKAVARLFALRRTIPRKPFIILISELSDLCLFGVYVSTEQRVFLDRVWPGPVSVVLPCSSEKYEYLHQGAHALAFRLPKSKRLQTLLREIGPLVAPSANPEGEKPAETTLEAKKYFGDRVDVYLSAGKRLKGKPSTLVSLTGEKPVVLRQGSVPIVL
ncbi:MAG: threonylcarbamoyl-AMP synthase [Candidatus Taylorbacteria bacterium CG11_big_fil_rev_8_21_14_0_20_46_11]|uniref:L-threonylcarbamoyladenylate synthase n=1 Tax=Candidatus Taylorbacteria bacterium CG11_big_fil_rev_8_21_14_0_20_46_11 TaxID=1975025 RepID=A0A2H0KDF6_9BACT|nr:MAG: threonylcarbamoyl-AMP synthase [Candidatus Taylorbacteria bacterium CG11_big_fil_rev_8_21_14_0_20_46_11]